jgi:diaminopimelate decarboxylase
MNADEAKQLAAAYLPSVKRKLREDINTTIRKFAMGGGSGIDYRVDDEDLPALGSVVETLLQDGFKVEVCRNESKGFDYLTISW